jgi:predicted Zn-dependent protease
LNRLPEARAIAERGIAVRPAYSEPYRCLYIVAYLEGDAEGMAKAAEAGIKAGAAPQIAIVQLTTKFARGQRREALKELEALDRMAEQAGRLETLADSLWRVRTSLSDMGAHDDAVRLSERSVEITGEAESDWGIPPTMYDAGRIARGKALQAAQASRYGGDQMYAEMMAPVADAAAALARGDADEAAALMERIGSKEASNPFLSLGRGRALLAAGRIDEAIAALERSIANRFVAEPSAIYPVAHIWLARAHARADNLDAARRAYDDAFAFWKDADPDIPILAEARKEHAALKTR